MKFGEALVVRMVACHQSWEFRISLEALGLGYFFAILENLTQPTILHLHTCRLRLPCRRHLLDLVRSRVNCKSNGGLRGE